MIIGRKLQISIHPFDSLEDKIGKILCSITLDGRRWSQISKCKLQFTKLMTLETRLNESWVWPLLPGVLIREPYSLHKLQIANYNSWYWQTWKQVYRTLVPITLKWSKLLAFIVPLPYLSPMTFFIMCKVLRQFHLITRENYRCWFFSAKVDEVTHQVCQLSFWTFSFSRIPMQNEI